MDLSEFEQALRGIQPGQFANVPYEIFELLFPPGVRDDGAKGAAYAFARERGFRIENRPDKHAVLFWRDGADQAFEADILEPMNDRGWVEAAAPYDMPRNSRALLGRTLKIGGELYRIEQMMNDAVSREDPIRAGERIHLKVRPMSDD